MTERDTIDESRARSAAEEYLRTIPFGEEVALAEEAIERPWGWVLRYNTKAFLETHDPNTAIVGAGPLLVERLDGNVQETASSRRWESYEPELQVRYEKGAASERR